MVVQETHICQTSEINFLTKNRKENWSLNSCSLLFCTKNGHYRIAVSFSLQMIPVMFLFKEKTSKIWAVLDFHFFWILNFYMFGKCGFLLRPLSQLTYPLSRRRELTPFRHLKLQKMLIIKIDDILVCELRMMTL